MARYSTAIESAAALGANTTFVNIAAGAAVGFRLRRVILGGRGGTGASMAQSCSVKIFRSTARGTASTTTAGQALDPTTNTSQITGVDSAWSVNPTLAAVPVAELSFNLAGPEVEAVWEGYELSTAVGAGNGLAFQNVGNALPASHLLTLTVEWEE